MDIHSSLLQITDLQCKPSFAEVMRRDVVIDESMNIAHEDWALSNASNELSNKLADLLDLVNISYAPTSTSKYQQLQ
jgi:hypothetical protein